MNISRYYDSPGAAGKFALYDAATGSFQAVEGSPGNIVSVTDLYIDPSTQRAYFGINTKDQSPAVYIVEKGQSRLCKGLVVEGQEIRALGKLQVK